MFDHIKIETKIIGGENKFGLNSKKLLVIIWVIQSIPQANAPYLGGPSFKKYRNFMKYFHKTVTPPPRTAFMKVQ